MECRLVNLDGANLLMLLLGLDLCREKLMGTPGLPVGASRVMVSRGSET